MATSLEELVQSLTAGQSQRAASLLSPTTQASIAAANPYYKGQGVADTVGDIALKTVASDPTRYGLGQTAAVTGISGLLSGLFGGAGDNYQNTLTERYGKVLDGDLSAKADLPSGLFNQAARERGLFDLQPKLNEIAMNSEVEKAKQMAGAKIQGELDAYGSGGQNSNVLSPITKEIRGIEDDATTQIKTTPATNNFMDIKSSFDTMKGTISQNTKGATLAFISSFARVLDPGSTVKEGEIKNAANTQAYLEKLGYDIKGLFSGEATLGENAKIAMLEAASSKYNSYGNDYQKVVELYRGRAKSRGGNPERVFGPAEFKPFDTSEFFKEMLAKTQPPPEAQGQPVDAPTAVPSIDLKTLSNDDLIAQRQALLAGK